jgi:uncharacterized protein
MDPLSYSSRGSPFSYSCNRCNLCCKEKIIRVNPYETARLAARLGISTSYFLKIYTMAAGTVLKAPYRGYCIFRDYTGCSVHGDRPLVCRLYPLRRHTSDDYTETFSLVEAETGCISLHGDKGTVGEYLIEQETDEYVEAADSYIKLSDVLIDAVRKEIGDDYSLAKEAARLCLAPDVYQSEPVPEWLNIDPVVSRFCASTGAPQPKTLLAKTKIHINAVTAWLEEMGPADGTGSINGCGRTRKTLFFGRRSHSRDRLGLVRTLVRTVAVLGYSIGVNLDELSSEFVSIIETRFA